MAFTNFYNTNRNRAFPFLQGSVAQEESGPLVLANLPNTVIVDAGFVLGNASRFDPAAHTVYLLSIRRDGDTFFFTFACDAPELYGATLTFTRQLGDPNYATEFVNSGTTGISATSLSGQSLTDSDPEPLWSGYLVTGVMQDLDLLLASDGTIDRGGDFAIVEPALLQSRAAAFVSRLRLANDDRTRSLGSDACPADSSPYGGLVHISAANMSGDLSFIAGYNASVKQDDRGNSITLSAAVGAGAGEPCEQVPLFDGETPPAGSNLLEGGLRCNETLRTINGIGGPAFEISVGTGVSVTSVPDTHTVVINVHLAGFNLEIDSLVADNCP